MKESLISVQSGRLRLIRHMLGFANDYLLSALPAAP
jgi:hypothetical protein